MLVLLPFLLGPVTDLHARTPLLTGTTEAGRYRISLSPEGPVIPIGSLHAWKVELKTDSGEAFVPRQFGIYGGMPAHGHGLAAEPQITEQLAVGHYLIDGLRFNMAGNWQIAIGVVGPSGPDKVTFDLVVAPPTRAASDRSTKFTAAELAFVESLSLPAEIATTDSSNRFQGKTAAISLGRELFFDPQLSAAAEVSCASCHQPDRKFTDGRRLAFGSKQVNRHTPGLLGTSYADWYYWDGRRDSLWSQAITPLEADGEMDNDRLAVVRYVLTSPAYQSRYAELTGDSLDLTSLPPNASPFGNESLRTAWSRLSQRQKNAINRAFSNIGKAIASYVATLQPGASRFDRFAAAVLNGDEDVALTMLNRDEIDGLRLFIDPAKTHCLRCHNGPLLSNHGFHNIGTSADQKGHQDAGRAVGLRSALHDPFNCRGAFSDADAAECREFRFGLSEHATLGAFKVPSLRNLTATAPYGHDGRFASLADVLEYYRISPASSAPGNELPPLELSDSETRQLAMFLETLTEIDSPPR